MWRGSWWEGLVECVLAVHSSAEQYVNNVEAGADRANREMWIASVMRQVIVTLVACISHCSIYREPYPYSSLLAHIACMFERFRALCVGLRRPSPINHPQVSDRRRPACFHAHQGYNISFAWDHMYMCISVVIWLVTKFNVLVQGRSVRSLLIQYQAIWFIFDASFILGSTASRMKYIVLSRHKLQSKGGTSNAGYNCIMYFFSMSLSLYSPFPSVLCFYPH